MGHLPHLMLSHCLYTDKQRERLFAELVKREGKILMIHNSKWRFGFVTGTLLLLWIIVLVFVLDHYLTMGPAFGLLYVTTAAFMLMTLLMLLLVFFKRTSPISFGLAIPLLVLHIGLFIMTLINTPAWNETNWELLKPQILFIHLPAVIAFL